MFQPFKVPFNEGIRQDNNNTDVGNGETFTTATNVMYTKKGAVRGRFGLASENALVQKTNNNGGPAIQDGTQLNTLISGKIPAGIEANDQQLFAMWQGAGYVRTSQQYNGSYAWRDVGRFWSTKKYSSTVLDTRILGLAAPTASISPVAVGSKLVNIPITINSSTSLAVVGDSKLDLLDTQTLTNYDATSKLHASIANNNNRDVIIYPKADGSVNIHSCNPTSISGSGTEVNVLAAGSCNITNTMQSVWIVAGQANTDEFFFAVLRVAGGQITVGRFNASTGTVTATLTLTGLGTTTAGVCLCHNGGTTGSGGALCLGFPEYGTSKYVTKIITCTNTATLTDAALNVSHGTNIRVGFGVLPTISHTVGLTHNGSIAVMFTNGTSIIDDSLQMDIRSFSSTSNTTNMSLFSANLATYSSNVLFHAFIPATTFCGQTVVGIYRDVYTGGSSNLHATAQWIILDVTSNVTSTTAGSPIVMASGQAFSGYVTAPINPFVQSNTTIASGNVYTFGIVDGILFDQFGVSTGGGRKIRLQATGTRQSTISNINMFTGSTLYNYDGLQMTPHSFVEGNPYVLSSTAVVGGSATINSSYSFQSTWEITNGKGQIIRSGQSNIVTASTTATNKQFTVVVTIPQLLSRYLSSNLNATVRLFVTQANPSNGAPLYLMASQVCPITSGAVNTNFVTFNNVLNASDTDTTALQLYTGGNVFDDQAPPSADRGIAFCNNRLWVADQDRVYVSKLLNRTYAPAFNTSSGRLVIEMPTSIGEIESLGSLDNKLAVIGSLGTAIIYGPGFDDLGNGPGWAIETTSPLGSAIYSSTINQYGPRIAANIPNLGVAFIGNAGELYQMNFNGQVGIIGRPMMSDQPFNAYECTYVDAGIPDGSTEHGPMILALYDKYKLIDIESARAAEWTASNISQGAYTCSFNGIVYIQQPGGNGILSMTTSNGQDLGVNFTQIVTTGSISISGNLEGGAMNNLSGRLRSVTVLGTVTGPSYTQSILVTPDSNTNTALINKSKVVDASTITTKWPWSVTPEFRATIQRCNRFTCQLTATPAIVEWSGLECWAMVTNNRFPSRNRN